MTYEHNMKLIKLILNLIIVKYYKYYKIILLNYLKEVEYFSFCSFEKLLWRRSNLYSMLSYIIITIVIAGAKSMQLPH